MVTVVYLAIYAGILSFVGGCIRRYVQYSRLPMHLRWELYPVPHEDPVRAAHGGSYFERADWAGEKQRLHRLGEVRAMAAEIFLLRSVWESNRRLWYASFVFHIGLYCLIASCLLAIFAAVLNLGMSSEGARIAADVIGRMYRLTGAGGAGFVLLGAAGLLARRVLDRGIRRYTTPGDIFNLCFFLAAVGVTAAGYVIGGEGVTALARGLITFDTSVRISPLFALGLVLASMLVAYIPFTHMAHFIGKYFTFHHVRWDDAQNRRGGAMEARIAGVMAYKPRWPARHIGADGSKSWPELAAANPAQEVRK